METMNGRAELEAKALADYQAALGTVITVTTISGYKDDDCHDFDGIEVQAIVTETSADDIYHWVDEYLDPYWNVEPIKPWPPELEGHRSFWTFGPGYVLGVQS